VREMQLRAIAEVQTRNPRLTDTNEGSVIEATMGAGAVLADECIALALDGQRRFYYATAVGVEIDALSADRGGPLRKPDTAAVGFYQWTKGNPSASYVLPAGHRVQGTLDDGTPVVVESTAGVAFAVAEQTKNVAAVAQDTGPNTNLAPGFLDTPVDVIPADPTATVSNAGRFVGGAEAESDEAYLERIRLFPSTLRRGTVPALEFGARTVPGVSLATVDESFVPSDGIVREYIGDPDARSNTALADAVEVEIENWRAAGVQVLILGSDREEIAISLTLTVVPGTDTATLKQDVRASVLAYTDALQPNETLRVSELCFRAHDADRARIVSVVSNDPVADVSPTAPQDAIRVNEADIAVITVVVS
jgi:uncharacterized phage protein gp47/JayE